MSRFSPTPSWRRPGNCLFAASRRGIELMAAPTDAVDPGAALGLAHIGFGLSRLLPVCCDDGWVGDLSATPSARPDRADEEAGNNGFPQSNHVIVEPAYQQRRGSQGFKIRVRHGTPEPRCSHDLAPCRRASIVMRFTRPCRRTHRGGRKITGAVSTTKIITFRYAARSNHCLERLLDRRHRLAPVLLPATLLEISQARFRSGSDQGERADLVEMDSRCKPNHRQGHIFNRRTRALRAALVKRFLTANGKRRYGAEAWAQLDIYRAAGSYIVDSTYPPALIARAKSRGSA